MCNMMMEQAMQYKDFIAGAIVEQLELYSPVFIYSENTAVILIATPMVEHACMNHSARWLVDIVSAHVL